MPAAKDRTARPGLYMAHGAVGGKRRALFLHCESAAAFTAATGLADARKSMSPKAIAAASAHPGAILVRMGHAGGYSYEPLIRVERPAVAGRPGFALLTAAELTAEIQDGRPRKGLQVFRHEPAIEAFQRHWANWPEIRIAQAIKDDDRVAVRAVMALWRRQTEIEQRLGLSIDVNETGLSRHDAPVVADLRQKWIAANGRLSAEDVTLARRVALKYIRQLGAVAKQTMAQRAARAAGDDDQTPVPHPLD